MIKNFAFISFILPALILINNYTYSANLDNYERPQHFSDNDTTTFSNIFNELNSAENTLQTFINMIFNIDTLYAIGNNNDIKILQTINNILDMKFVKDYFLLNGGVAPKKYKQLLDDAKNFNYKTQQSKQSNKLQFIDQYNIYSTKFQEFFKTMSDKLQLLENTVYACQFYKMDTSRNNTVTSTKLNIFNKILEYLKQYKQKDTIEAAYKTQYKEIWNSIANKPLYDLLNIEKNFFNTIFNKIQSTKAKEQMTNISKFANILLGNLIVILERDNNEILQKIDSTLEIDTVKQYFKENQFEQTVIMQFKKKIKEKYDRDINKDDYKTFVLFFQEQIQNISSNAENWVNYINKIKNYSMKLRKNNNQYVNSIKNKLETYFSNLQEYCYSKLELTPTEIEKYFLDIFELK